MINQIWREAGTENGGDEWYGSEIEGRAHREWDFWEKMRSTSFNIDFFNLNTLFSRDWKSQFLIDEQFVQQTFIDHLTYAQNFSTGQNLI